MSSKKINLPLINPSLDAALSLGTYLENHPDIKTKITQSSKTEYYVTGSPSLFQRQVEKILGREVEAKQIIV
jgi:glutamate racemase